MQIGIQNITLLFECEHCQIKHECDPIDLAMVGVPLCPKCNDEMAIENYAEIKNLPVTYTVPKFLKKNIKEK